MHVVRTDHLVLTVGDIGRTVSWYEKVLGMRAVTFGNGRTALRFGAQKLNLHQAGRELEPKAARPTPGSADLCLVSAVPLADVLARLDALGVVVEEGPVARTGATGPITSVYVRDPDRNLIEVSAYDSGRPEAPDPYDLLPAVAALALTSDDVRDGAPLGRAQLHPDHGGSGTSPHLRWDEPPPETASFAVTCLDPDAPTGSGLWHWLLLGLPAGQRTLPSGAATSGQPHLPATALQLRNDLGRRGYSGATQPEHDPPHRYLFAVHALDTDDLAVEPGATGGGAGAALVAHTLARGVLCPIYPAGAP